MLMRIRRNFAFVVTASSVVAATMLAISAATAGSAAQAAPTTSQAPTLAARAGTVMPSFPLSTSGNMIVDASGKSVTLQGVNWFGFETANHAPHGLWTRDYIDMLTQIKQQGFNTIRMPFSLQALASNTTSGIDYANGRNAALAGKTPQQVMDIIIDEAAKQGLMVLLDCHSLADDGFMHELWYGQGGFTEADWISTWQSLATRYATRPNVIGADLKNEPHGSATWGTGAANDWRRAAEAAGNAVLAKNPSWLVMVEGIEGPVAGGQVLNQNWWGGNLEGVRQNPVRLNVAHKLVYSVHEYGPVVYAQPWFSLPDVVSALYDRWNTGFGYIFDSGTAPILVGEFGAKTVGTDNAEGKWFRQFSDYLSAKGMSWTFWAWNPNSGDTGGVLKDDWNTVNADKMALLTQLMQRQLISFPGRPATIPAGNGGVVTPLPSVSASPASTPTPTASISSALSTPTSVGITATTTYSSDWGAGFCAKVDVTTTLKSPVTWSVNQPIAGSVTNFWNSSARDASGQKVFTGASWNTSVSATSPTSFGYCADRVNTAPTPTATPTPVITPTVAPTPVPTPTPTSPSNNSRISVTYTVTSDWGSGRTVSVVVRNLGATAVNGWSITMPWQGTNVAPWNAVASARNGSETFTNEAWNGQIPAGGSTSFGFNESGAVSTPLTCAATVAGAATTCRIG